MRTTCDHSTVRGHWPYDGKAKCCGCGQTVWLNVYLKEDTAMKITLAFSYYDEDPSVSMPTLVSAYDEYTEEEWGGVPSWHTDAIESLDSPGNVRECTIEIPDKFVKGLFETPELPVDWQTS